MADYELHLRVEQAGAVRAVSSGGSEAFGQIADDPLYAGLLDMFGGWARRHKLTDRREFELFGSLLWRAVVPSDVERLIDDQVAKAKAADSRLRIQLTFEEEAHGLASLPWEYLFRPDRPGRRGYFLATAPALALSRYMPLIVDRDDLAPKEGPLRILAVTSTPTNLDPVLTAAPLEAIEGLAGALGARVSTLDAPTPESLVGTIQGERPHVVHLMGHGRFDPVEGGAVALLDDDGKTARWVDDRLFADLIAQVQVVPRLFVLHLCEGAAVDFDQSFAGVAPQLIRTLVPAVIAMQYPITNGAAATFIKAFYGNIAAGQSVDDAAQAARFTLSISAAAGVAWEDFGVPVIYMRSRGAALDPAPAAAAEAAMA